MKGRLIGIGRNLLRRYERREMDPCTFAIVSNNCWGYEIYRDLHRPYNTPFIGLYILPEDYLHLLEHLLPHALSIQSFQVAERCDWIKNQPHSVGILRDGVRVHFLHYQNEMEARERWDRRCKRLQQTVEADAAALRIKFCDRDGATTENFIRFHSSIKGAKVSFSLTELPTAHASAHCAVPKLRDPVTDTILDGVNLYWSRYRCFDFTTWIKEGKVKRTFASQCWALT